jgi:hypothetical protein
MSPRYASPDNERARAMGRIQMNRRNFTALTFAAATAAPAAHAADLPKVTAVPGAPALRLGAFDLKAKGYVVEEFFLAGTAQSYRLAGEPTVDGRWRALPAETAPYATRIVVVRPADPKRFNGTVAVEWLNVTAGLDAAPDWSYLHRELMRGGYAYVGVSAQRVGVEGGSRFGSSGALKSANPTRYGALSHPGDAYSFDMFTQVGRVVDSGQVLGGLKAARVLAMGESQSASYLTTYVNAVDPLAKVFDGFLIHSRSGGAALLSPPPPTAAAGPGGPPGGPRAPIGTRLRDDLRVPVLTLIAETDLIGSGGGGFLAARQPDSRRLRTWEMAGTAHVDNYALMVSAIDTDETPMATKVAAWRPTRATLLGMLIKPMNAGPQHHYIAMSALSHLDRWVRTGRAPPKAPQLEVTPAAEGKPATLVLDAEGNAKGGIRSPWVDVPTARHSGLGNSGGPLGFLAGSTEPYDAATLARLYPGGGADYRVRFTAALDSAIKAGFILPADRAGALALAEAVWADQTRAK